MTPRSISAVLVSSLLFACSQREPAPDRTVNAGLVPDSSMTRLPVEHWGNQLGSPSRGERRTAMGYLAYYGVAAEPYIPVIAGQLTGSDDSLGFVAAWSLAHIGAPAYPALTLALESGDARVRQRAAYGIGEAGPAAADSALRKLDSIARNDPEPKVREMADWALDQISPRQSVANPNLGLTEGLNSEDLEVRIQAVRRLGVVPAWNRVAIVELIRLLADTSEAIHRSAIDALVQKGRAALPLLQNALDNSRERVRSGATAAISRIHGQL